MTRARFRSWHDASFEVSDASQALQEADPQAGLIARWLPGVDVVTAQDALRIGLAVAFEICAAFGLYLATGHGGGHSARGNLQKTASGNSADNASANSTEPASGNSDHATVVPLRPRQEEPRRFEAAAAEAWVNGGRA